MLRDGASFDDQQVLLLPASHRVLDRRPVAGVTLRVESLDSLRRILVREKLEALRSEEFPRSLFLSPSVTHGLWLEFREGP